MSETSVHDQTVTIEDRQLRLRNLDKVLYPDAGTTKAEIIDYYARIAPVLLPRLADRPVTRLRWPDGVESKPFFEKNLPSHAPEWLRTVELPVPGSTRNRETIRYPLVDDLAGLVWLANLAALELHVPQWRVGARGGVHEPDRLVIDLDPGAPAGLAECAQVALLIRDRLADDGLQAVPVTSGSKGLQLYVPLAGTQAASVVSGYAKNLAETLEREHRDIVVAKMAKTLRPGKVLLDWSQNNPAKTTICPYSMRGRSQPWVAAPRAWDEVEAPATLRQLSMSEVLARVAEDGDLSAPLDGDGALLP